MQITYRINWTDKRAAQQAIASIKEFAGKFDAERKVWVIDTATIPSWRLAVWEKYAAYSGMTAEQILAERVQVGATVTIVEVAQ